MEKETMELISKLTEIKTKYNLLIDYLLNDAELSYNNKNLRLNDCTSIIKALEPNKYNAKFKELTDEKIEKHIPIID